MRPEGSHEHLGLDAAKHAHGGPGNVNRAARLAVHDPRGRVVAGQPLRHVATALAAGVPIEAAHPTADLVSVQEHVRAVLECHGQRLDRDVVHDEPRRDRLGRRGLGISGLRPARGLVVAALLLPLGQRDLVRLEGRRLPVPHEGERLVGSGRFLAARLRHDRTPQNGRLRPTRANLDSAPIAYGGCDARQERQRRTRGIRGSVETGPHLPDERADRLRKQLHRERLPFNPLRRRTRRRLRDRGRGGLDVGGLRLGVGGHVCHKRRGVDGAPARRGLHDLPCVAFDSERIASRAVHRRRGQIGQQRPLIRRVVAAALPGDAQYVRHRRGIERGGLNDRGQQLRPGLNGERGWLDERDGLAAPVHVVLEQLQHPSEECLLGLWPAGGLASLSIRVHDCSPPFARPSKARARR